jgi:peptidyl-dipeptidase Dcp
MDQHTTEPADSTAAREWMAGNPLLGEWETPFKAPPFDAIAPEHFRPAFDAALGAQRAEVDAIAGEPATPTFANTVEALERSGKALRKVASVFLT